MDNTRLEEIKAMVDKTTRGYWSGMFDGSHVELWSVQGDKQVWLIKNGESYQESRWNDIRFIVAAPSIVRELLAEIERLKER